MLEWWSNGSLTQNIKLCQKTNFSSKKGKIFSSVLLLWWKSNQRSFYNNLLYLLLDTKSKSLSGLFCLILVYQQNKFPLKLLLHLLLDICGCYTLRAHTGHPHTLTHFFAFEKKLKAFVLDRWKSEAELKHFFNTI